VIEIKPARLVMLMWGTERSPYNVDQIVYARETDHVDLNRVDILACFHVRGSRALAPELLAGFRPAR
jgi:hypothetical protein